MIAKSFFSVVIFLCCLPTLFSCGEKHKTETTNFTKLDTLTDTYLALQDSILQSWNVMINDDNQKLETMQNLLHELKVSGGIEMDVIEVYEERLNQLKRTRYTQKTMANDDVVQEYDFASNAMVSELISLTETQRQFAYNTTLQRLADNIRVADQRVNRYREQYDQITQAYNTFLEKNYALLQESNTDSLINKKPLFQMVSDD